MSVAIGMAGVLEEDASADEAAAEVAAAGVQAQKRPTARQGGVPGFDTVDLAAVGSIGGRYEFRVSVQ